MATAKELLNLSTPSQIRNLDFEKKRSYLEPSTKRKQFRILDGSKKILGS